MKQIIIVVFLYTKLFGQNYSISVFGFHACDVIQTISSSDKIEFRTQNRGLFDIIWPANNYYEATFNPKDFSLKNWSKIISQGDYKKTLSAAIDTNGTIVYNNKNKIFHPFHVTVENKRALTSIYLYTCTYLIDTPLDASYFLHTYLRYTLYLM